MNSRMQYINPNGDICQDDYEYATQTGRYAPKDTAMYTNRITISTNYGDIIARPIGNGVVSWECPQRRVSGIADQPIGWGMRQSDKNEAELNAWHDFMDEVIGCIKTPVDDPIDVITHNIPDSDMVMTLDMSNDCYAYSFHSPMTGAYGFILSDPLKTEAVNSIGKGMENAWNNGYYAAMTRVSTLAKLMIR
jgi:hypothetical protein